MERKADGDLGETEKYMKEIKRILDAGTGSGGNYLNTLNASAEYWCIDKEIGDLRILKKRYSSILAVKALVENIPFKERAFDSMVILFPGGTLLSPGLQSYVPYPPEMKHEPTVRRGSSWYSEFARVLKPQGQLTIYGDWLLLPDEILSKKDYVPYFEFKEKKDLKDEDLFSLGTSASNQTIIRRSKNLESPAYRLIFEKY